MSSKKDILVSWRISTSRPARSASANCRKTGKGRIIVMRPNLIAWLKPYAKPSGRICELNAPPMPSTASQSVPG